MSFNFDIRPNTVLRARVHTVRLTLGVSLILSTTFCTSVGSTYAQNKPTSGARTKASTFIGVVDDIKLLNARSDFPALLARVLPDIAKRKNLRLVLHKSGFAWGTPASAPTIDITEEVIARLKQIPPSEGAIILTGEQMVNARQALEAIHNLQSRIDAGGFSYDDFNTRVLDAQVVVSAKLRQLPPSPLRDALDSTLAKYRDSRDVWKECLYVADLSNRVSDAEREQEMSKLNPVERLKLSFKKDEKREERLEKAYAPLYATWRQAEQLLNQTEALLPK